MCGMSLAGFYSRLELCNGRIHRVTKMVFGGISMPSRTRQVGGDKVTFAYASGTSSDIYHLVVRNEMETLCGLRVSRLKSQHALHVVTEVSPRTICKHCERIQQNIESEQIS